MYSYHIWTIQDHLDMWKELLTTLAIYIGGILGILGILLVAIAIVGFVVIKIKSFITGE